ncbi:MAG: pyruvate synthase subunit PorC [Gammaproteobacteria bacterium]
MREIVIVGRGGQGAQTAGIQLAQAFYRGGQYVQTFATYGGARRGTPVFSSLRVDDQPIRLRCDVVHADAILVFDETLLDATVLARATDKTQIVVNSAKPASAFADLGPFDISTIDGLDIAARNGMGKVVNSALLGAFVAKLSNLDIDTLCQVIEETAPVKHQENVAACREAYEQLREAA